MRRAITGIMIVGISLVSLTANVAQHRKIHKLIREMREADSVVLRANDLMRRCQEELNSLGRLP